MSPLTITLNSLELVSLHGMFIDVDFTNLGGQNHKLFIDATGYNPQELNYGLQSFSDNLPIRLQRN